MESASEQEHYLLEMLDPSNPDHLNLVKNFKAKLDEISGKKDKLSEPGIKVYKKKSLEEDFVVGKSSKSKTSPQQNQPDKKSKTKFVSLYSKVQQNLYFHSFF